jgi:hypothetical protein
MAEAFVMNIMQRGNDGAPDRVLDAPTNEAWIDPWVSHLRKLGVRFHVGQTVEALDVAPRPGRHRARPWTAGAAGASSTPTGSCPRCPSSVRGALWSPRVLGLAPGLASTSTSSTTG